MGDVKTVPLDSAEGEELWRKRDDRERISAGDAVAALWWHDPTYYCGRVAVGPDRVSLGLRISAKGFRYLGDAYHVVALPESAVRPSTDRERVPSRIDPLDALLAIWIAQSWLETSDGVTERVERGGVAVPERPPKRRARATWSEQDADPR